DTDRNVCGRQILDSEEVLLEFGNRRTAFLGSQRGGVAAGLVEQNGIVDDIEVRLTKCRRRLMIHPTAGKGNDILRIQAEIDDGLAFRQFHDLPGWRWMLDLLGG